MKCEICKNKIEETFLKKLVGTQVKVSGKFKGVCQQCQRTNSMEEIKTKLS